MTRSWMFGVVAALLAAQPPLLAAQDEDATKDAAKIVSAVWVQHELTFMYMPLTSYYSCDGLRDKVSWLLKELGARPGFKVVARGCIEALGPEVFPGVKIVAEFPAEATPELLASLASEASKLELKARASGKPAPVAEATEQFPARVKRVDFRSGASSADVLQNGDCELIEQLRDRAFGPLGVKVVADQMHCVPRQISLGAVRLSVEVLEPLPAE